MKSNTLKLSLVLALSLAALAACDKHGKKSEEAAAPDTTNAAAAAAPVTPSTTTATTAAPTATPMAGGGDLREKVRAMKQACAADITKFCSGPDAEKPGRCLREHKSELSPGCATAHEALVAARKAEKAEKGE